MQMSEAKAAQRAIDGPPTIGVPIEVRVCKFGVFAPGARITAVWPGVGNVTVHQTRANWREFLTKRGWVGVPRVWDAA
jgi:hypothetical protein